MAVPYERNAKFIARQRYADTGVLRHPAGWEIKNKTIVLNHCSIAVSNFVTH